MLLLCLGLLLFCLTHLLPMLGLKTPLKLRLGALAYKGIYSLLSLAGLAAMIVGFSQAPNEPIFTLPFDLYKPFLLLNTLAVVLLAISYVPSNLRQWFGHPMMIGTVLWSLSHLLMNGDQRSMLLFAGLFICCLPAFPLYSRLKKIADFCIQVRLSLCVWWC